VRTDGTPIDGGAVEVDAALSSQFASALLLVAPYALRDVTLVARNLGARDYVEMTTQIMQQWGADVETRRPGAWNIAAGAHYQPQTYEIEYDASAACHLFALAMATGGDVTVLNCAEGSLQPDARLLTVFAAMGGVVERQGAQVTVHGPPTLAPVDVDLSETPDQVMTIATLAALASDVSTIRNVAVARAHETDRLTATASELAKFGVTVEELPDGLIVHGGSKLQPARIATWHDHRMAMAFAALALVVPGTVLQDPGCVRKTYPGFWDDLQRAGVAILPAG
jgi:3-phosphoshikimate 1-carboxyvinyltransferase